MNELTVHVAWWLDRSRTIVPRLVLTVAWYVACLKAGLAGGTPTLREAVPFGLYVPWLAGSARGGGGGGVGVAVGPGGALAAEAVWPPPPDTTTWPPAPRAITAQLAAAMMPISRHRWARWIRRACCRS